jgi:hypothetical protein
MILLQDRQFARIETEARHAGIDMQDRRELPLQPMCLHIPRIDFRR